MRRVLAFGIAFLAGWLLWDALSLPAAAPAAPPLPARAPDPAPPAPAAHAAPAPMPQGYCARCKAQRDIRDPHTDAAKDGRPMLRGTCATCGAKIARFLKADEPSAP